MKTFRIIRTSSDACRLVELYAYNGVCRTFEGKTNVSDAIRFIRRVWSGERKMEIVWEMELVG